MLFDLGRLFLGRGSFLGEGFRFKLFGGVELLTPAKVFSFSDTSANFFPTSSVRTSSCLAAINIFSLISLMSSSTSSSISPELKEDHYSAVTKFRNTAD